MARPRHGRDLAVAPKESGYPDNGDHGSKNRGDEPRLRLRPSVTAPNSAGSLISVRLHRHSALSRRESDLVSRCAASPNAWAEPRRPAIPDRRLRPSSPTTRSTLDDRGRRCSLTVATAGTPTETASTGDRLGSAPLRARRALRAPTRVLVVRPRARPGLALSVAPGRGSEIVRFRVRHSVHRVWRHGSCVFAGDDRCRAHRVVGQRVQVTGMDCRGIRHESELSLDPPMR